MTRLTKEVHLPTTQTKRYATAKLAAAAHDLAAYHVRGEDALTNFCVAAARHAWRACPQTYPFVLERNLQAAIARLQAIGAARGTKAGTQLTHHQARASLAGGPIGLNDAQAVAARMVAATMTGAGLSSELLGEVFQAFGSYYPSKTPADVRESDKHGNWSTPSSSAKMQLATVTTRVLVLAAMRAPA